MESLKGCGAAADGSMTVVLQVIERAQERWAEDSKLSALCPRMTFVGGDFFKHGGCPCVCSAHSLMKAIFEPGALRGYVLHSGTIRPAEGREGRRSKLKEFPPVREPGLSNLVSHACSLMVSTVHTASVGCALWSMDGRSFLRGLPGVVGPVSACHCVTRTGAHATAASLQRALLTARSSMLVRMAGHALFGHWLMVCVLCCVQKRCLRRGTGTLM